VPVDLASGNAAISIKSWLSREKVKGKVFGLLIGLIKMVIISRLIKSLEGGQFRLILKIRLVGN
jgi:DMSO reductase anchor subunit